MIMKAFVPELAECDNFANSGFYTTGVIAKNVKR